jgi:hypothetical protein
VVGIGVGVDGVREGLAATPGFELLEIGIGMEEFRKRSVTTSGLVWLELGLVWTEFGKLRQQHRGFCTDFESLVFIDFIQTSQSTLDANIHDKKHKHCSRRKVVI